MTVSDIVSVQVEGVMYWSPGKTDAEAPSKQEELRGPSMGRVSGNGKDETKDQDCGCLEVFVGGNKLIV